MIPMEASQSNVHGRGSRGVSDGGWVGDAAQGIVRLIDQTRLPTEFIEIDCHDMPTVWEAIKLLAGSRSSGDWCRGRLRGGHRRAVARAGRHGNRAPRAGARPRRTCAPAGRPP